MFPKFCSKFADKSCLTDIKFSSHNQCFAAGGQANTLQLFDMRRISNDMQQAMFFSQAVAHEDYVSKIQFSPTGELFTGGGFWDCLVKNWDIYS